MSTNKGLLIAMAAGATIAGLAGYLLISRNELKVVKREKVNEDGIADRIEDIIKEAKQKFSNLQEEILKETLNKSEFVESV